MPDHTIRIDSEVARIIRSLQRGGETVNNCLRRVILKKGPKSRA